jgi:hypothetical protein
VPWADEVRDPEAPWHCWMAIGKAESKIRPTRWISNLRLPESTSIEQVGLGACTISQSMLFAVPLSPISVIDLTSNFRHETLIRIRTLRTLIVSLTLPPTLPFLPILPLQHLVYDQNHHTRTQSHLIFYHDPIAHLRPPPCAHLITAPPPNPPPTPPSSPKKLQAPKNSPSAGIPEGAQICRAEVAWTVPIFFHPSIAARRGWMMIGGGGCDCTGGCRSVGDEALLKKGGFLADWGRGLFYFCLQVRTLGCGQRPSVFACVFVEMRLMAMLVLGYASRLLARGLV